jgi:hypothetical protein
VIWSWLQLAWHFLFGWAGVDMLIGFAAVAVAVLEPPIVAAIIPDLRKWAICVAIVAFTLMGAIAYGYKSGSDEKQRQWDAALVREFDVGEKARASAEHSMPDTVDRWVLNADHFNRNRREQPGDDHKGPVRWLAVNPFRRVE